jgi:hypothetical protein
MSKVTITIEDKDDSELSLQVNFDPAGDEKYPSNRAAAIALVFLSDRLGFDLDDMQSTKAAEGDA